MESFHMRALRSILGIKWQDRITNLEVLDRANSTGIESMLIKAQLRWVGHVIRMEEFPMPRRLMYGELQIGKRNQGRPKRRYKDTDQQAERVGGASHGQTKEESLEPQNCCQPFAHKHNLDPRLLINRVSNSKIFKDFLLTGSKYHAF